MATIEPAQMITAVETVTKSWTNPEWLRFVRLRAGISQATMADRIGCTASYLSNIECGLTVCSERVRKAYEDLA